MNIDFQSSIIVLMSLNESFMKYYNIVMVDCKDNNNISLLKSFLYGMKSYYNIVNSIVDDLENRYGLSGGLNDFRISSLLLKQAESFVVEKENEYA